MTPVSPAIPPAKRRVGRPRSFAPAQVRTLLRCIGQGAPFVHAVAVAGLSNSTFCKRRNEDAEFRARVEKAVAKGIARRLARIERAAATDWRAAAWLLEHCQPQHFAVSRQLLEVSGPNGSPLAGVVAVMLPPKQDSLPAVTVPALAERNNGSGN